MRRVATISLFVILLGACASSVEPEGTSTSTDTPTTTQATTTSLSPVTTADDSLTSIRELGLDPVTLQPAEEGGPHPTLSWDAVADADTYWLFLRNGAGQIYWAWSGSQTAVRVGGGSSPDLNQTAALHEPMTWSVMAFDAAGELIALSEVAEVSP